MEIWRLSASAMAEGIRAGEFSSADAVEACIARIEQRDGHINALPVRLFGEAREAARRADERRTAGEALGALHGVPITIKEQFRVADTPVTLGLARRQGFVDDRDGPLVARLRDAGAIILGKTNVLQLLLGWECENPIFGRTLNPWSDERTPGGSSGGEAAIVAYGGSPLGLGADFGGSIRLPAAFCGVCGLKPTSGRLTNLDTPPEPFSAQPAVIPQSGPIARTVADLSLAMSVLAAPGLDRLDPLVPPVPWVPPDDVPIEGLRVGWFDDNGLFAASPAIRRVVREAAAILEQRGARVVPFEFREGERLARLFAQLVGADGFAPMRRAAAGGPLHPAVAQTLRSGSTPPWLAAIVGGLMAASGRKRLARLVRTPSLDRTARYFEGVWEMYQCMVEFLERMDEAEVDLLLCPPVGLPAFKHGTSGEMFDAVSYAFAFNLLGLPGGVVPVGTIAAAEQSDRAESGDPADRAAATVEADSAGMPVGVQVVGRRWREDLVLAAMSVIEAEARGKAGFPATPV